MGEGGKEVGEEKVEGKGRGGEGRGGEGRTHLALSTHGRHPLDPCSVADFPRPGCFDVRC